MLQEISIAEMNGKRISYFELTESEWEDLKFEMKRCRMYSSDYKLPEGVVAQVYGIDVRVEGKSNLCPSCKFHCYYNGHAIKCSNYSPITPLNCDSCKYLCKKEIDASECGYYSSKQK